MRFFEHNVYAWSFPAACTCDQFHFYFAFRFLFCSSDLAHKAPIICTAVVVRLFAPDRDSCVLASCCGLPLVLLRWSILQFSLRLRIVAAYFFICYSFFFQPCFSSTRANPGSYEQKNFIFTDPREDFYREVFGNFSDIKVPNWWTVPI